MKKKLLYVGHVYHRKTHSCDFMLEILSRDYEISRYDYDPLSSDPYRGLEKLSDRDYDVLVAWQFMPSPACLRKYVRFRRGVFFPMFDYYRQCKDLSHLDWDEYRDFLIVNFSRAIHEEVSAAGFESRYIQYFPKPAEHFDWGDEKSVFFWQRVTEINPVTVWRALRNFSLKAIHLHQAIDPGHSSFKIPQGESACARFYAGMKVTTSTWYDTREEMLQDVLKSSLYVAPRYYEGIGMSFLEAMASGRCVVAPDGVTMTEYIDNGKTGLIYDFWDAARAYRTISPIRVPEGGIRAIQRAAYESIKAGYARWERERWQILDWLKTDPPLLPYRRRIKTAAKVMAPKCVWDALRRLRDSISGRRLTWSVRFVFPHARFPLVRVRVAGDTYRIRYEFCGFPLFEYKLEGE